RDAQIVWEARDQEPVIATDFAFVPKSVGEQWIEAEATWPDGRRAFAKAVVNAGASMKIAANRFQAASFKTSPDIVSLYPLDSNLVDANGRSPAVKLAGNAKFDTSNLSWMSQRMGAALRFQDINDKAFAAIDLTKLGPASEVTLEAMLYVDAFKAYNRTNA